jgi:hypothetical protein
MGTHIQRISKYKPSIFQGSLDFKSGQRVALALEHPNERLVFRILCIALALLACGYLYFVTASVMNVIARKEALAHSAQIRGTLGSLEQKYFALSDGVTPEIASSLGLTPLENTQYVYKPSTVGVATIDPNGI